MKDEVIDLSYLGLILTSRTIDLTQGDFLFLLGRVLCKIHGSPNLFLKEFFQ